MASGGDPSWDLLRIFGEIQRFPPWETYEGLVKKSKKMLQHTDLWETPGDQGETPGESHCPDMGSPW